MTSREFDELASAIDDASTVVEELQVEPQANTRTKEKLNELHDALEQATESVDTIADDEEKE